MKITIRNHSTRTTEITEKELSDMIKKHLKIKKGEDCTIQFVDNPDSIETEILCVVQVHKENIDTFDNEIFA